MIIYHGSYTVVEHPDISFSRDNIDFGKGFYTTPIKDQATKWAEKFKKQHRSSIISIFEIDEASINRLLLNT